MRQRALIAIALACRPRLLIADEPTTALDVTIQAQILTLLKELVDETGTALIMITHDLGVVAGLCDDGQRAVRGQGGGAGASGTELFAQPRHPYTYGLLGSVPRLDRRAASGCTPIRGSVSDNIPWAEGCAFAPALRPGRGRLPGRHPTTGARRLPGAALHQPRPARRGGDGPVEPWSRSPI